METAQAVIEAANHASMQSDTCLWQVDLGLGAADNVTFNNIVASDTLTARGTSMSN
jgi:hypothetical protein